MLRIDLNCDLGESFATYTLGMDADVIPHITRLSCRKPSACAVKAASPWALIRLIPTFWVLAGAT